MPDPVEEAQPEVTEVADGAVSDAAVSDGVIPQAESPDATEGGVEEAFDRTQYNHLSSSRYEGIIGEDGRISDPSRLNEIIGGYESKMGSLGQQIDAMRQQEQAAMQYPAEEQGPLLPTPAYAQTHDPMAGYNREGMSQAEYADMNQRVLQGLNSDPIGTINRMAHEQAVRMAEKMLGGGQAIQDMAQAPVEELRADMEAKLWLRDNQEWYGGLADTERTSFYNLLSEMSEDRAKQFIDFERGTHTAGQQKQELDRQAEAQASVDDKLKRSASGPTTGKSSASPKQEVAVTEEALLKKYGIAPD